MTKKSKVMCKDCGEKYAQEMGRCRRCWNLRINGKPYTPSHWKTEAAIKKNYDKKKIM